MLTNKKFVWFTILCVITIIMFFDYERYFSFPYNEYVKRENQNTLLTHEKYIGEVTTTSIPYTERKEGINKTEILLFTGNLYLEKVFFNLGIKFKVSKYVSSETSVIVFENYDVYLKANEDLNFKNSLIENKIGIIVFNSKTNTVDEDVTECYLNDNDIMNEFLYVTKFNKQRVNITKRLKFNSSFRKLFYNDTKSVSILKCEKSDNQIEDILFLSKVDTLDHVFIYFDNFDNIWFLKSLFIDSIRYLSKQKISVSLKRYVLVDIDDIFLTKINETDYYELIKFQNKLSENYFYHDEYSFKLNLGMSGRAYNPNVTGDRLLMSIFDSLFKFSYILIFLFFLRKQRKILLV